MASFNKVILMGNLTRDPELRYTAKGTAIARIGLAVNRTWRTESGESRDETTFVDCDAFGRQAETLCQYMKKGNPLMVEGRLKLHSWEDKQTGQKKNVLRVTVENFQFLGSPNSGGGGAGGDSSSGGGGGDYQRPRPATPVAPQQSSQTDPVSEPEPMPPDDDVPF